MSDTPKESQSDRTHRRGLRVIPTRPRTCQPLAGDRVPQPLPASHSSVLKAEPVAGRMILSER